MAGADGGDGEAAEGVSANLRRTRLANPLGGGLVVKERNAKGIGGWGRSSRPCASVIETSNCTELATSHAPFSFGQADWCSARGHAVTPVCVFTQAAWSQRMRRTDDQRCSPRPHPALSSLRKLWRDD